MDYEKAYNDALERAKDCHVNKKFSELDNNAQELCEYIFPELRESEDERIRKAIYNCVKWFGFDSHYFKNVSQEECLAWLEKQGEKQDYNPYKTTIESISAMVEKYANGDLKDFYDNIKVKCKDAMEYDNTWLEKQGEREWNTDEKDKITNLKTFIAKCKGFNRENIQKAFDMIDSLKPQPHWKPTEEQIHCFKCVIDFYKTKVNDTIVLNLLNSLYNNLLKL